MSDASGAKHVKSHVDHALKFRALHGKETRWG